MEVLMLKHAETCVLFKRVTVIQDRSLCECCIIPLALGYFLYLLPPPRATLQCGVLARFLPIEFGPPCNKHHNPVTMHIYCGGISQLCLLVT